MVALDDRASDMKPEDGGTMVPNASACAEVGPQAVAQRCRRARRDAMGSDPYESGNCGRKLRSFTAVEEKIDSLFWQFLRKDFAERVKTDIIGELSKHSV